MGLGFMVYVLMQDWRARLFAGQVDRLAYSRVKAKRYLLASFSLALASKISAMLSLLPATAHWCLKIDTVPDIL